MDCNLAATCVRVRGRWARRRGHQTPARGPGRSHARPEPARACPLPGPLPRPARFLRALGVTLGLAVGHFIWAVGNNRLEIAALGARVWSAYLWAQQLLNLNDCEVFLSRRRWHRLRDAGGRAEAASCPSAHPVPAETPPPPPRRLVRVREAKWEQVVSHRPVWVNHSVKQNYSQWPSGGSTPRAQPRGRRATQGDGAQPLKGRESRHGLPCGRAWGTSGTMNQLPRGSDSQSRKVV